MAVLLRRTVPVCAALAVVTAVLCANAGLAQQSSSSAETHYYYSHARLISLTTGQPSSEEVLLARTIDPGESMITEIACVRSPGRPTLVSPVYMKVSGNRLKIADTRDVEHPHSLIGTGTVMGAPWHWNYLTFSMTFLPASIRIEDANFVTPGKLIGRKQIFAANGTPLQLYDLEMDPIIKTQYDSHNTQMGCPAGIPR